MVDRKKAFEDFRHYKKEHFVNSVLSGDAIRSVRLASELLNHDSEVSGLEGGKGLFYLDPVTSFAFQNKGRGYSGEITVFLPHGALSRASEEAGRSLVDRAESVSDISPLLGNRGGWSICNTKDGDRDGHVVGFWNDGGSSRLTVHIRELERGLLMPSNGFHADDDEVSFKRRLPILSGDGIVLHATRSMTSMSRDPDYLAASYMAIHAGMTTNEKFKTMQEFADELPGNKSTFSRLGERGSVPDIKTADGASLFLREQEYGFSPTAMALQSVFSVRPEEVRDIRRSVANYIRDTIQPAWVPSHIDKEAKKSVIETVMSFAR